MNSVLYFAESLKDMFLENPLAQAFGFLAFFMSMYTFLSKQDDSFLWRMTYASALWTIHFVLLYFGGVAAALSAGLLNFVDIWKNLLAIYYPFNKKIAVSVVAIYLFIAAYMYFFEYPIITLFPIAASIASTITIFMLRGIAMRISFLCILLSWFFYNLSIGSMGGVLTDSILFLSGSFTVITMMLGRKKEEV